MTVAAAPSQPEADDAALLAAVAAHGRYPSLSALTRGAPAEIVASHGVDFATALLYDRVRSSPEHARFISEIDAGLAHPVRPAAGPDTLIAVVPAAFYQQMPRTGADGRVVLETATQLGLPCELVPLRSAGTMAENARILCGFLKRRCARRIILVSLCKGGADVKYALHSAAGPSAFEAVSAWVNVCGTLDGSPFVQWLLKSKPRFIAAWVYFRCNGHDFELLREIVPAASGLLAEPLRLPAAMRFITVAGFPRQRHLSNGFMRRCHRFISAKGPNDGGVLLGDVCRLPGSLYPVWGADHYLRPDNRARAILAAIFAYLLGPRTVASAALAEVGEGR